MKNSICILFCAFILNVSAQTSSDVELNIYLRNGNFISGISRLSPVELQTDYGKLLIPLQNISLIEMGIAPDKGSYGKITTVLKQLGNSSEDMRKAAYNELMGLDISAIPVIESYIYSGAETQVKFDDYSAEGALNDLKSQYNITESISDKDVVTIDYKYSIAGVCPIDKIEIKTSFGSLSIPKSKIEKMEIFYRPASGEYSKGFKLMAAKHISANTNGGWLNTGISVRNGQKIDINATGMVTLASLDNKKYKPDGSTEGGGYDTYQDEYGYQNNNYPTYGCLVYRIGEGGQQLKAGSKFSSTVTGNGMLYISIYESVYSPANSGFYTVTVEVK